MTFLNATKRWSIEYENGEIIEKFERRRPTRFAERHAPENGQYSIAFIGTFTGGRGDDFLNAFRAKAQRADVFEQWLEAHRESVVGTSWNGFSYPETNWLRDACNDGFGSRTVFVGTKKIACATSQESFSIPTPVWMQKYIHVFDTRPDRYVRPFAGAEVLALLKDALSPHTHP